MNRSADSDIQGRGPVVTRLAVTAVLGSLLVSIGHDGSLGLPVLPLVAVVAGAGMLSLGRLGVSPRFAFGTQVAIDLLLETLLVAKTAGTSSPLVLLYVLTILTAGLTLGARASVVAAVGATLSFAAVAGLVGGEEGPLSAAGAWYQIGIHGGAFLLLALLSGTLAERSRRSREEADEANQELQRVQMSTDHILEHVPIGIVTTSPDGRIVRANHTARDVLGLARGVEPVGEDLAVLLEPLGGSLVEAMEAALLTRKWSVREEVVLRRETQDVSIGVAFKPLVLEDERLDGLIVTLTDLSQVRRMEREMLRSGQLAQLGELAAGVAHEIRNPLASISGAAQVMSGEVGRSEEERELTELIVRESDRLNRIIDGVLDYTRDHSNSRHVHDVSQTATEVVRLIKHDKSLTMGKTVLHEFPEDQSFLAECEENGLKQVFLNLAQNALQAMSVGGILRITGQVVDGRIYVVFRDTGTGIAPHELENVFKPFHTSKQGGTGLGLSIASRIVEGNGGSIQVKSTPGVGTAFTVELCTASEADRGSSETTDLPMQETNENQTVEATLGWPKSEF